MSSGISEGIGNSIFSYTIGEIENFCKILGREFCHYFSFFFFGHYFLKWKRMIWLRYVSSWN